MKRSNIFVIFVLATSLSLIFALTSCQIFSSSGVNESDTDESSEIAQSVSDPTSETESFSISSDVSLSESNSDEESFSDTKESSQTVTETKLSTETDTLTETEVMTESETEAAPYYKVTKLPFVTHIDFLGNSEINRSANSNGSAPLEIKRYRLDESNELAVAGWCILEGGIAKYIWSVDGGKTWHNVRGNRNYGNDDMLNAAQKALDYTFEPDSSVINAHFQGCGSLRIDLSKYNGEVVSIMIAAVPLNDTDSLAVILNVSQLKCN